MKLLNWRFERYIFWNAYRYLQQIFITHSVLHHEQHVKGRSDKARAAAKTMEASTTTTLIKITGFPQSVHLEHEQPLCLSAPFSGLRASDIVPYICQHRCPESWRQKLTMNIHSPNFPSLFLVKNSVLGFIKYRWTNLRLEQNKSSRRVYHKILETLHGNWH